MIGHIIRAELGLDGDRLGMVIEAKPADEAPGYGYPRGKRLWYAFNDDAFTNLVRDVRKPEFRDHGDLLGVEVNMELDGEKLVGLKVSGGPRRYLESDSERQSREKRTGIAKEGDDGIRSRRFYACRGRDGMQEVIEALPIPVERKRELTNLCSVLTRMVLAENDGNLSDQRIRVI